MTGFAIFFLCVAIWLVHDPLCGYCTVPPSKLKFFQYKFYLIIISNVIFWFSMTVLHRGEGLGGQQRYRLCQVCYFFKIQGAPRLLADLNLAPSALRWWEKDGVDIIGKGTSQSFVSPWISECHALVEGGTSVRRGGLLFKWPLHYCNSTCLPDPVQYSH